jgi:hypothetical protein
MTRRTICIAIALTSLILVAANSVVSLVSKNSVPRQKIRVLDSAGPVIDVLGMGNSLMAAGFDTDTVEHSFEAAGRPIVAVNAALGSTYPVEHLALARRALRNRSVKQLIYGFFDQQMSEDVPLRNSDLIGNHAMLYYVEPQLTLQYGQFGWMDLVAFQTYRCCALLRERGNIWAKIEKTRRAMESVGMPHQATNQFGRVGDFDLLEFVSPEEFIRRCQEVMRSGAFLSPPIRELFKEANAQGVKITVVEMPLHAWHVKTFYDLPAWEEFRRLNRQAVESFGAGYIDASHWIPDEAEFQDHIHLGHSGAAKFSKLLSERLIAATPSPIAKR